MPANSQEMNKTPANDPTDEHRVYKLPSDSRHTLWAPSDYQHRGNQVDLLFDFHGSPNLVRENAQLAGLNCVVISVKYNGLSSVYREPFSHNRQLFATILDESLAILRTQPDFGEQTEWGTMAVSSFSAGFGAVRELLKTPAYFDRIDGIFMVDSLYCGYVGDGTDEVQDGVVHPGLMQDFLRYAKASVDGKKTMIITHCMEPTPGYASTRETADYLLLQLDLKAEPIDVVVNVSAARQESPGVLRLYRKASRNRFSLYGSTGLGATDHVEHLRRMAHWLPQLPLAKRDLPPKPLN